MVTGCNGDCVCAQRGAEGKVERRREERVTLLCRSIGLVLKPTTPKEEEEMKEKEKEEGRGGHKLTQGKPNCVWS